ncbi:MAG: MFS transporter [Actinomycetota bacterium]|nr:MFS transporter [Actinomycetota bacterium]MDQ3681347.1 MFS transporter [Actinomycetota bacterium]
MRVVTDDLLDSAALSRVVSPRAGLVLERADGRPSKSDVLVFEAEEGPFRPYRRTIEIQLADHDLHHVRQVVEYRADIPYFGWLFDLLARRHLGALGSGGSRSPWWSPPERLDAHAARALASLCALSVVLGYLGTLLTQTMTFAAAEFGADKSAQGVALAVVRADVVLAVGVVAWADRRGRKGVLVLASAAGCAVTATGAVAPSLFLLAASQVAARGLVTAAVVIVGIVAAEEMPAGSRAYAVSLMAMSAALGAGLAAVFLLPVADVAEPAWRLLFALALTGLPLVASVSRRLPESRRFQAAHAQAPMAGHGRRFLLLGVSGFLLNMFLAPAAQFSNEYLRTERGFSAGRIALFTLLTATPGSIGIIAGGRLAERGRRLVAAVGVVGGVGATVLMYLASGWPLWAWSVTGSILGAATVPALGVYGPELFPTSLRGRANGLIAAPARLGSVAGLLIVGHLAASSDSLGPAMALLALGPAVLAVAVVVAYPETAHRELEELNPEDAPDAAR